MSDVLEPERDGAGFNANDWILKETADWLSRQGGQTSIDQLAPRVERAMKAYQICKGRLDVVQETLGSYLPMDPASPPAESVALRRPLRDGVVGDGDGRDGDGDIPF
jgi:hypothetical protein